MDISRRAFLTSTGAVGTSALFGVLGLDCASSAAVAAEARPQRGKITTTICPFCGVGCGQIVEVRDGRVVGIEGDPDHPINEGSVCSKGAALYQIHYNERRLRRVRYRKPGASDWQEISWDQAMRMIAHRVKKTRDETWVDELGGQKIHHASGIACLGGAALDSEECYLISKAMRGLGVVWLEHQARI
jgi:formate dehydrogenase major subunit